MSCRAKEDSEEVAGRAQRQLVVIAASCVLVLGLGLRIRGIAFGLPYLYHEDEWQFVTRALAIGSTHSLHPGGFSFGSLNVYLDFVLYAIYTLGGLVFGRFASVQDVGQSFFIDPTPFYLLARALSMVCGVATIYLVFLIGRRLAGPWAGVVGSAFLAVYPGHVAWSHYACPDTLALMLVTAALWVCIREQKGNASYSTDVRVGLLIGLAVAAKYLLGIGIVGYVLWRVWTVGVRRQTIGAVLGHLMAGCGATLVGFAVGMPYFFLDIKTALGGLHNISRVGHWAPEAIGYSEGLSPAWEMILKGTDIGLWAALGGTLGMVLFIRRRTAGTLALIGLGGANLLWAASQSRLQGRWLFPVGLIACIGMGCLLQTAGSQWKSKGVWRVVLVAAITVCALAWIPKLGAAWRVTSRLVAPDNRTSALQWMDANIPSDEQILIVGTNAYNPQPWENARSLQRTIDTIQDRERRGDDEMTKGQGYFGAIGKYYKYREQALENVSGPRFDVRRLKHTAGSPAYEYNVPLEVYVDQGVTYIVSNSSDKEQTLIRRIPSAIEFYAQLERRCTPVAVFEEAQTRNGPTVIVWAVPQAVKTGN
jgi:hypothetical protein